MARLSLAVFFIAGSMGVLAPGLQRAAGWGLIALLFAVFPANVQMAADIIRRDWPSWGAALVLLRMPVQLLLLWWVYAAALR